MRRELRGREEVVKMRDMVVEMMRRGRSGCMVGLFWYWVGKGDDK